MSESLPLHGIHYWEFKIKVFPKEINSDKEKSGSEESKSSNEKDLLVSSLQQSRIPRQETERSFLYGSREGHRQRQSANLMRSTEPKHMFVGLC